MTVDKLKIQIDILKLGQWILIVLVNANSDYEFWILLTNSGKNLYYVINTRFLALYIMAIFNIDLYQI